MTHQIVLHKKQPLDRIYPSEIPGGGLRSMPRLNKKRERFNGIKISLGKPDG